MLPMNNLFTHIILLGVCALSSATAVTVNTNAIRNKQIFGIEFPGETRAYFARENMLRSISKQEYITTGFRVVEVNVMTDANALLRIYYSRPLMPGEYAAALATQPLQQQAFKPVAQRMSPACKPWPIRHAPLPKPSQVTP